MRVAFFEDAGAAGFGSIALLRPVFELLCGHFSLRERVIRSLTVTEWGVFVRPHLTEAYREEHPEARVNDLIWLSQAPTLLINGRWLPSRESLAALAAATEDTAGILDGTLAYLVLEPEEAALLSDADRDDPLRKIASTKRAVPAPGTLLEHPWDLIDRNPAQLVADFRQRNAHGGKADLSGVAVLGNPEDIFIHPSADVDPFVVIDARSGPVYVDAGVRVQAFTRLEGPVCVGLQSQLFRANVRAGTSIGPVCRIGGEIEASIIHGHANKYHDGFLGHSYVCPWVNLGALTSNSDLKNDYSTVRVPLCGQPVDSGSTKVGCFIGDHSKTALCSQFNTGSSIGVMAMILPGGELLPKFVPSFCRVWHGRLDDGLDLEAALETARIAMSRRGCELTPAQERLLRHVHALTAPERAEVTGAVTPARPRLHPATH